MTLDEAFKAAKQSGKSAVVNIVGKNKIFVTDISDPGKESYVIWYETDPRASSEPHGGQSGPYASLEKVQNSFIDLSFVAGIDPNGWIVSDK